MKREKGFTMIESTIALLIFMTVASVVISLYRELCRLEKDHAYLLTATNLAKQRVEMMLAEKVVSIGTKQEHDVSSEGKVYTLNCSVVNELSCVKKIFLEVKWRNSSNELQFFQIDTAKYEGYD